MKNALLAVVLTLTSLLSLSAHAAQYNFSYSFASGDVVSGSLTGTQNGLFVENVSNVSVSFNGTPFTGNTDFYQAYYFSPGCCFAAGAPAISFDGDLNNFYFSDAAPNTPSTNVFVMNGTDKDYWYIGDLSPLRYAYVAVGGSYVGYDVTANSSTYPGANGGFDAGRWSLTLASEVPEPATYTMLLAGLGLLVATARRRKNLAL